MKYVARNLDTDARLGDLAVLTCLQHKTPDQFIDPKKLVYRGGLKTVGYRADRK